MLKFLFRLWIKSNCIYIFRPIFIKKKNCLNKFKINISTTKICNILQLIKRQNMQLNPNITLHKTNWHQQHWVKSNIYPIINAKFGYMWSLKFLIFSWFVTSFPDNGDLLLCIVVFISVLKAFFKRSSNNLNIFIAFWPKP